MKAITSMLVVVVVALFGLWGTHVNPSFGKETKSELNKRMIERGKWLVNLGGCHDCHSAKVYGPTGAALDSTRLLARHPAEGKLPELPTSVVGPGKWTAVTNEHLTAWYGPWGVSFARNLTPDIATGIGSWTEQMFIKALRTGKDMGEGRDILPPMPWQNFAQLDDSDLKAIFTYLRSLKPIHNPVPDPIPPGGERAAMPDSK